MNEKTHYEVMGLEPGCTADDVRKRFRELARKYHPDRNPEHPHYHDIFVQISQAYDVLSDSTRRARYDLDLRDRARRQAAQSYGSAPAQKPNQGNGRARPNGAAPPPRAGGTQSRARRDQEQRRVAVVRLMDDARHAYARGHLGEALRLCNDVLRLQRVGAAYDLMGDIYARQNRLQESVQAYTIAAQTLPNNGLVMSKLNRVAARLRSGGDMNLPRQPRPQPSNLAGYKMAVASFGFALVLFLVVWGSGVAATKGAQPVLGTWTLMHLGLLGGTGLLSGAVLAAGAWIRPIDQELFFASVGGPRKSMPVGLLVTVAGALFLPLALGIYLLFARLQESISGSMIALFGAVVGVTLGFALAADPKTAQQTLLLGGNVVWLATLCGWFIGDLFRPSWAT